MKVLLVEDSPADARLVREMTKDSETPIELVHVSRLSDALRRVTFESFDVALLDLGLPDCLGLEALSRLKAHSPDLPIVIHSGFNDETRALEAVRKGAQDYLQKNHADGVGLSRSLRYAIERQQAERQIQHLAYHDGLTGLPNRRLFFDRLNQSLSRSRRQKKFLALLFMDLDNFKYINDSLGHHAGDQLLQQVAGRVSDHLRDSDTLARLGGDEFALIVPDLAVREHVNHVAAKIHWALERPFSLGGREERVVASIGASLFPEDGDTGEALLRAADAAMYRAKQAGSRSGTYLCPSLGDDKARKGKLAGELRRALDGNEFVLHYQPRVDTHSGKVVGLEALLRWQHPVLGLLPPSHFIPAAEEMELLVPIGQWVLATACARTQEWNTKSPDKAVRIAVNLSGREFSQKELRRSVQTTLETTGLPPERLELELTESGIMTDEKATVAALQELKELGVQLCIDDFGIGHSSLSRLKRIPLNTLKIDRSFVRDLVDDPSDSAIVTAIITMAHGMGLRVVGEGVETIEQRSSLTDRGCDEMQGYYFSPPRPVEAVEALLADAQW